MSIRVGTIVNVNDVYNNYRRQIKILKEKKTHAHSKAEKAKYDDAIRMTEMEVQDFLQLILPDPEPSKVSPYLSKGYDTLQEISNGEGGLLDLEV